MCNGGNSVPNMPTSAPVVNPMTNKLYGGASVLPQMLNRVNVPNPMQSRPGVPVSDLIRPQPPVPSGQSGLFGTAATSSGPVSGAPGMATGGLVGGSHPFGITKGTVVPGTGGQRIGALGLNPKAANRTFEMSTGPEHPIGPVKFKLTGI